MTGTTCAPDSGSTASPPMATSTRFKGTSTTTGLASGHHGASLVAGEPGVIHGSMTYLLQDRQGQILEAHSISAGLDYPGVGPEHSYFKDQQLVEYESITDDEAVEAVYLLASVEGIIPALESSHAVAYAEKLAQSMSGEQSLIINLSGRGDKDINTIARIEGIEL